MKGKNSCGFINMSIGMVSILRFISIMLIFWFATIWTFFVFSEKSIVLFGVLMNCTLSGVLIYMFVNRKKKIAYNTGIYAVVSIYLSIDLLIVACKIMGTVNPPLSVACLLVLYLSNFIISIVVSKKWILKSYSGNNYVSPKNNKALVGSSCFGAIVGVYLVPEILPTDPQTNLYVGVACVVFIISLGLAWGIVGVRKMRYWFDNEK